MLTTGERITLKDALNLLEEGSLLELGKEGHRRKVNWHGDQVTYVHNHHINPTNLCVYSCRFCDFTAKKGDSHAYSLDEDDILAQLTDPALQEVHIVGGLWPKWGYERSLGLVRRIRSERPDLWIKAFTAVEVAYFARMERCGFDAVIRGMMEAGVDMMPGGGAEILVDRLHRELYADKIGPDQWLEIHETAHTQGLLSNATMLFGHIETSEEIVEHLFRIRELQDRTQGFQSFIPLAYQPGTTKLVSRQASAPHCLRIIALSRIVLDNIPHIKAYWPTLQEETAVAALNFGADDLDGTLGKERIMQLAGTVSPAELDAVHMETMIRHAGQHPVARDGRYNQVDSAEGALTGTR